MKGHLSILVFVMACGGGGSNGGGDDGNSPDAPKVYMDAPQNVPAKNDRSGRTNFQNSKSAAREAEPGSRRPILTSWIGAHRTPLLLPS